MKRDIMRSILCLVLAGAMLLSVTASAAGKKDSESIELFGDPACGWFYVPSTLPEGVTPVDYEKEVRLHKYSWRGEADSSIENPQGAETATLTFVSGDEALKDALVVTEEPGTKWVDGEQVETTKVMLRVNNDQLTAPGTALFHLSCEGANFALEQDIPLIVLSWEEDPLITPRENPELVTLRVGESFDASWVGLLARESRHEDEILQRVPAENWTGQTDLIITGAADGVLEEDYSSWRMMKIKKSGSWDATYTYEFNNILWRATVPMQALPYWIQGPDVIRPGEAGEYKVTDQEGGKGRTFTWSLEGEGVTLDAETGTVTVAADAAPSTFVLTATPSDGQPAATFKGAVGSGLLAGVEFALDENAAVGFSFSYPSDAVRFSSSGASWYTVDDSAPNCILLDYYVDEEHPEFAEDPETAREFYADLDADLEGLTVELDEEIEPEEGHPARVVIVRVDNNGESYSLGILLYARNNRMAQARLFSMPQNGTPWEELPKVEKEDMIRIAEGIKYNHEWAPISVLDAAITLSTKEETNVVTAGKRLTFLAAFADPEKVNKQAKNDAIEWSVTDANGGEAPAGVSIGNNGVLSTGKTDTVLNVEVKATSPVFHVSATYPVTIIPAVQKISVEPAELFFYTGTDTPQTVKAVLEPEAVPPVGITWTAAKADLVEITPDEENGTATIKPLAAGKTAIAVKEPGGKNAKLNVSVVDPVEDVELAISGKTTPGGTVTVKETIVPKQAGNKNVEWSLDVGEDIATVSKGKVKIAKDAPVGTVITVTCTALGAPEPVVRTVQIEVTEK